MAKNTICIKSKNSPKDEFIASGTITPGMMLEIDSNLKVKAHATAGGPATKLFAIEDENIGNGIADNYTATLPDVVRVVHARPGDWIYAIFDDDSSQETPIVKGDYVVSSGDGRVRKFQGGESVWVNEQSNSIIGIAQESQSTAGGRVTIIIT